MKNTEIGPKVIDFDKCLKADLVCPIAQTIMEHPVIAADGHSYEEEYIRLWFEKRGARALSPLTGEVLEHRELIPNKTLKKVIDAYNAYKPQRKVRTDRERDLLTAVSLREEEIAALLKKQSRLQQHQQQITATIQRENDALKRAVTEKDQHGINLIKKNKQFTSDEKQHDYSSDMVQYIGVNRQTDTPVEKTSISERTLASGTLFFNQSSGCLSEKPVEAHHSALLVSVVAALVQGDLSALEGLFAMNLYLLNIPYDITDFSDRFFKQITPLQHAIWQRDIPMMELIMRFLSKDAIATQWYQFKNERNDIISKYGAYVDFMPLITYYEHYLSHYAKWQEQERKHYWKNGIGAELANMPSWWVYKFTEEGTDSAWAQKNVALPYKRTKNKHYENWHANISSGLVPVSARWRECQYFLVCDIGSYQGITMGIPAATLRHDLDMTAREKTSSDLYYKSLEEQCDQRFISSGCHNGHY